MRDNTGKTIPVLAMWQGGYNYGYSYDFTEEFPTLWQAKEEFRHRRFDNDSFYPGVDDTSYMDIYLRDSNDHCEPYCRFTIGERGGIRKEFY